MRSLKIVLAAGVVGLSLVSSVRAEDYKVTLDRPMKVGQTFDVSTKLKVKQSQKVTANGNESKQDNDYTMVLTGTETVAAVTDKDMQPSKYTFKVTKCTKDGTDVLPAGATVTAENVDGKTVVTVDGKEPAAESKVDLMALFDTADPKDPPADQYMGTAQPQKVGGTWDMNSAELAKKLAAEQLPVTEADVKGTGKLVSVDKVDGVDTETIGMEVTATLDNKELPGAGTVHNGKIKLDGTGVAPVDPTAMPLSNKAAVTVTFTATADGGTADVSIERVKESTFTPSK